ncbi:MAG: ComEC/Rec2 family competence protein, partial [Pseudomonadota bacterium]
MAGAATAPFAALHFNRVGQLGVLANMLAVPAMGAWVMPLLFIGLILWPIGLEAVPFWLAGQGIAWIILVAEWVAGLPLSVRSVPAPGPWVLPLLGLAMASTACARGRWRWSGAAIGAAAALLWVQSPRPDLLIAGDGRLVGVMTAEGRWISRPSGVSFVADIWLENDGDPAAQSDAFDRPLSTAPPHLLARSFHVTPRRLADVGVRWIGGGQKHPTA